MSRIAGSWKSLYARGARLRSEDVWQLLQATAAATVAWVIARHLIDHREPFFAPIAALVALNASLGERGLNALRLVTGVIVGIAVAELTLVTFGGGYGSLTLATFVALLVAQRLGGARVVRAQAGIAAILTVAVANGEVGYQRLTDALIGAGVALLFSQLLFSPEPLRLLRRVETDALRAMATALELTSQALEGDDALADMAIESLRELRDHLSELARMRHASTRVARHSLVWRGQIAPLVRETEDAGYLDLLGGSCLLLVRTSLDTDPDDRQLLTRCVRALSTTLDDLARQPGDREARQRAANRSLEILRGMRSIRTEPNPDLESALAVARVAVTDLMLFVGVDPDEARAATRAENSDQRELDVPAPASATKRLRALVRRLRDGSLAG